MSHVLGAESGYARMVGIKHQEPAIDDTSAIAAHRGESLELFRKPSDGQPLREKGWPIRYATQRFAWHVLDHGCEIQDRSEPAAAPPG